MSTNAQDRLGKVSWLQSARYFFSNESETKLFTKIAAILAPAAFLDDAGDIIPGLDIVTIGDNMFVIFTIYAIFRITYIKKKANAGFA